MLGHLPDGGEHRLIRPYRVDSLGFLIQQLLHGKHRDLRISNIPAGHRRKNTAGRPWPGLRFCLNGPGQYFARVLSGFP
jgi:hypothetical protein